MPFRSRSIVASVLLLASVGQACACGLAWSPNPADALLSAKLTNRLAIVVFTGSDWSRSTAQLDQEVLMNVEFTDFATRHFALANADFPQRNLPAKELLAENTEFASRHKITKWPTLLAIRPDGSEFGRIEYGGENAFDLLKRLEEWQARYQTESSSVRIFVE
ncbi:hypothetical protein JIN84_18985 [Luteolibacter yonseiensis]|uniref:Uncharacterized protein n=1 Tax=Luteolibacter yonseiensis TaxID=1144680 RepID=A0A934R7F2_9BACT|nr:hypothetical protein [Luteolibacter yonseiensis]MBK1817712.1 hypothetical protein [Luteolibacter yonseiensis]